MRGRRSEKDTGPVGWDIYRGAFLDDMGVEVLGYGTGSPRYASKCANAEALCFALQCFCFFARVDRIPCSFQCDLSVVVRMYS